MLSVASCSGPSCNNTNREYRKRKNDDDITAEPGSKLPKEFHQYYFVLESDDDSSEEDSGSGSSISSIHNKSTDFAKSTSDTLTKTDESDRDLAGVEYEVASLSESKGSNSDGSYSSGSDFKPRKDFMSPSKESDQEDKGKEQEKAEWADSSSDAAQPPTPPPPPPQSGLNSLTLRSCIECGSRTPLLRYCRLCHKRRKDLLPLRPKRRSKRGQNNPRLNKSSKACEAQNVSQSGSSSLEPLTSSSSQEILEMSSTLQPRTDDVCGMCFKNPKNGGFIHGIKWVHVMCCYQCCLKVWNSRKSCPLCNGKIRQVIRVAIA